MYRDFPADTDKFYKLLGLQKHATDEDIKRAWKKHARMTHPDKGGHTHEFQEIQEAFEVLNNPAKRQMYDRYGKDGLAKAARAASAAWPGPRAAGAARPGGVSAKKAQRMEKDATELEKVKKDGPWIEVRTYRFCANEPSEMWTWRTLCNTCANVDHLESRMHIRRRKEPSEWQNQPPPPPSPRWAMGGGRGSHRPRRRRPKRVRPRRRRPKRAATRTRGAGAANRKSTPVMVMVMAHRVSGPQP